MRGAHSPPGKRVPARAEEEGEPAVIRGNANGPSPAGDPFARRMLSVSYRPDLEQVGGVSLSTANLTTISANPAI